MVLPVAIVPTASFKSCPREGASGLRMGVVHGSIVSSHAPVRGHQLVSRIAATAKSVSSHAPVRGHLPRATAARPARSFKSCPREGASVNGIAEEAAGEFQVMPP